MIGGLVSVRDQATGRLEATIPFSFKSFGEDVKVEVLGVDGDVLVQVKSTSRLPIAVIDWGKNSDNVKHFSDWLTKAA